MDHLNQHYLLEELLDWRSREMNWELARSTDMNELIPNGNNGWSFDCSDSLAVDQHNLNYFLSTEQGGDQFTYCLPTAAATASTGDSMSYSTLETPPSSFEVYNGEYPIANMEEEELGILEDEIHNLEVEVQANYCKVEPIVQSPDQLPPIFNTGATCDDFPQQKIANHSRSKKLRGQPSKNLMAERRRRKRLNDRLSMLRSIVPKISKMDRTAILADAIEYVKELVEKIKNLEREIEDGNGNSSNKMGISRDHVKPMVRNSPKFNVEMREGDKRIEICCASKPGLLLSTVHTLEELGLDIQQCVISCFSDFSIQASCSQGGEQRRMVSPEEVKQALFENAGYGGKCM